MTTSRSESLSIPAYSRRLLWAVSLGWALLSGKGRF